MSPEPPTDRTARSRASSTVAAAQRLSPTSSATWDQENRLTGAAGYTYTYDGEWQPRAQVKRQCRGQRSRQIQ